MTCGHNKSFKERCIECELVLVREGLAWSERKASEYRDAVVRLEAELAPTKPQPNFAKSSLASGALTEPQTSWQPIETAPKDGTLVLICGFGSEGYYVADAKWDGEWLLFHPDNDDHTEPSYNVSYWMPLPAPPSEVSRPDQAIPKGSST
jgi:hypothetical protein